MKKKGLIVLALAASLAAMPVVAGAASGSPSYSGGSDGGGSSSSSSSSTAGSTSSPTVEAGAASGAVATVPSQPTVQVAANGEKTTVASTTKDAKGTTIGLVTDTVTSAGVAVTSNAKGEVVAGTVTVGIATGAAETAGLQQEAVEAINALNSGVAVSTVLPGLGLEGYNAVGGTRAIVASDAATGKTDTATEVSLTVDTLPENATVTVVCYDNNTGKWTVLSNVKVDPVTKKLTLVVPGSCTIQVVAK